MQIHHYTGQLPAFHKAVITIGTFDGVHSGHARILRQLREEAARIGGETLIITFYPHPRKIVKGGAEEIRLLNILREKIELLSWQQIDHLVIVPFTEAFSQLSAEQYIEEFLLERFHPHTVIIGYDHRFGKGRLGDYHLLEQFSTRCGFRLQEIPVHLLDQVSVSSTRIREAIGRADIATANLEPESPDKLIPADGVYAVEAQLLPPDGNHLTPALFEGPRLKGMMGIGIRPTINGTQRTIEVNLFDFDQDIYGREMRVFVIKYLRPELKFNSLDELKAALAQDKLDSLAALA